MVYKCENNFFFFGKKLNSLFEYFENALLYDHYGPSILFAMKNIRHIVIQTIKVLIIFARKYY